MKKLYECITPKYAENWKVLGGILSLPNGELDAIEARGPANPRWCCNRMLERWLELDSTASWIKILKATMSPPMASTSKNGNQVLIGKCFYMFSVEHDTPSLKDLYEHITPRYAADWRVIGTLLGLSNGELKAIEAGYPTNFKWCCNKMLEKWLELDPTASWIKILTAIESPAVSSGSENGMYYCLTLLVTLILIYVTTYSNQNHFTLATTYSHIITKL